MSAGSVLALQIAGVALLVAVIVAAAWGAGDRAGAGAAVHDAERALGAATIMTYERAAAGVPGAPRPSPEGKADRCAICVSEYAGGDELVRVVPACGHFFHAEYGVDGWLRARRTCPLCRAGCGRWPLPECPPMPASEPEHRVVGI